MQLTVNVLPAIATSKFFIQFSYIAKCTFICSLIYSFKQNFNIPLHIANHQDAMTKNVHLVQKMSIIMQAVNLYSESQYCQLAMYLCSIDNNNELLYVDVKLIVKMQVNG